jgi:hypothetical protein
LPRYSTCIRYFLNCWVFAMLTFQQSS